MKILNFGSLNLDLVFKVERIVRPGETISSLSLEQFCGGKGLNQSIALARAGAEVYHAGCIGSDGEILKKTLADNHVDTRFLQQLDCSSGQAIIQVDEDGQNSIILYGGANRRITSQMIDSVLEHFDAGDILLVQNEISSLPYLMDAAGQKGMVIVFNPSPFDHTILLCPLHRVSLFVINEIEGEGLTGCRESNQIIEKIKTSYPGSKTVLTLGKDGAVYYDGQNIYQQGIFDVKVEDTTAAGDTFLGYFVASMQRVNAEKALRVASVASSLAVSVKGASNSIPFLKEVESAGLEEIIYC